MRLSQLVGTKLTLILMLLCTPSWAAEGASVADAPINNCKWQEGLVDVCMDNTNGRILIALPAPGPDGVAGRYLYVSALKTGLGSAPIKLDRAKLGATQVLVFKQVGNKVLGEFENPLFRATATTAEESTSAREAFATSVIWAGKIETILSDNRRVIDISDFLTRDVMGIANAIKKNDKNPDDKEKVIYKTEKELTVADPTAVKVFPENVEFEAIQTFSSDEPGLEINNIAPEPKFITLTIRHSLVKLPEQGYKPRQFDPRSGAFDVIAYDYATPLDKDIVQRFALRFRLEKTDSNATVSTVKKPIVFYVDRAAPEPIRNALLDGAAWWGSAFEAAGFQNAYQVKILPEGADPLDIRYNVINWVDRATRGWSYGQTVTDPRTGEIIKGSVLLGSLRVRQDMLIFEGLVGADQDGNGGANDPIQVSLSRLRQLAAHEVGHSLGFSHNFAASSQDRASVMDYPPPRLKLTNGQIDLSDAYGVGVGVWDRYIVDWLYGDGDPVGKAANATKRLRYVSDEGKDVSSAQPYAAIWDDGPDPVDELARIMKVRRLALDKFGPQALRPGEAAQNLKRKYVPIYLLHRYQLEAAAKMLGGIDFSYAVKGDDAMTAKVVSGERQRAALLGILATLAPAELDTPESLIPLLSSGLSGEEDRQYKIEVFASAGNSVFDSLAAVDGATGIVMDALLSAPRLARLVDQHRRNPSLPGVSEVLDRLITKVFATADGRLAEIARREQTRSVLALAETARQPDVSPAVRAEIGQHLADLAAKLKAQPGKEPSERAHRLTTAALLTNKVELQRLLDQNKNKPNAPPGMPIGEDED